MPIELEAPEIPEGISESNFSKAGDSGHEISWVRCPQELLASGYSPIQFINYY